MEESTNGGELAVAGIISENSSVSELNTEQSLNCATASTKTASAKAPESETSSGIAQDVLELGSVSENPLNTSCTELPEMERDLAESTTLISGQTMTPQAVKDVNDTELNESAQAVEKCGDNESAPDNLAIECITASDTANNGTYSYLKVGCLNTDKAVIVIQKKQSATLKMETNNTDSRCPDIHIDTGEEDVQGISGDKNSVSKEPGSATQRLIKLVIPTSSEKSVCHEVPHTVTRNPLEPTEVACSNAVSHVTQGEVIQSTNLPRYILVKRKSVSTQEPSKKPGGKLTSLLQRLTAVRGNVVTPEWSVLTDFGTSIKSTLLPLATAGSSSTGSSAEPMHTEQAMSLPSLKEPFPNKTENSSASSSQIQVVQDSVSHKPMSTVDLFSKSDSPTDKHSEKDVDNSSGAQTSQSTLLKNDSAPLKMVRTSEVVQSGSQICRTEPIRLLQTKPPKVSKAEQVVRVCRTVSKFKQSSTSLETESFVPLGQPALISADNRKYVLGCVSLKGTPCTPTNGPKEHSNLVESVGKPDTQPSSGNATTTKSKHQFSLLQNTGSKHPLSFQMNTSANETTKTPTIYSLLANSSTTSVPMFKPSKYHSFEATGVVPVTASNLASPAILQDSIRKPFPVPRLGPNRLIITPNYTAGQIFFQQVPHSLVASGNTLSSEITTLALSKLTSTTTASSKSTVKDNIPPGTSFSTAIQSRPPALIIVPTASPATPGTTILAIPTRANSKKALPAGITTLSNMSTASRQTKAIKTISSFSTNSKLNTVVQLLTSTPQSCSKLISKIAQQSLSRAYTKKATMKQPNLAHALEAAMQPKIQHESPTSVANTTPSFRIIVSRDSDSKNAKYVSFQTTTGLLDKESTSTRPTLKMSSTDKLSISKIQTPYISKISQTFKTLNKTEEMPLTLKTEQKYQTYEITQTPETSQILQTPVTSKRGHINLIHKTERATLITKTTQVPLTSTTESVTLPSTAVETSGGTSAIDNISKCRAMPLSSKPLTLTVSCPGNIPSVKMLPRKLKLVLPTTSNAVSLLTMSSAKNVQSSAFTAPDKCSASALQTNVIGKLKSRAVKSKSRAVKSKLNYHLANYHVEEDYTVKPVHDTRFKNISAEAGTSIPIKPTKNAVYSAILKTGQGPVSGNVVAPDMDGSSSETLSASESSPEDKGVTECFGVSLSDLRSRSSCDAIHGTAPLHDDLSNKGLERGKKDLICLEKLDAFDEDGSKCVDITVLDTKPDTEILDLRYSNEVGTFGLQPITGGFDEEETDSDLDIGDTEEQDMSVLRQLLMDTASTELYNNSTVASKHFLLDKSLNPHVADGLQNRQCSLEPYVPHNTHLVYDSSCLNELENKFYSRPVSAQQISVASFTPHLQNDIDVSDQSEDSEFCGLKIESIFSLSGNGDLEDAEYRPDDNAYPNLPEFANEQLSIFNVRYSVDWKNCVSPCYVVLERLPQSEILAKGSAEILSKCSGHCRKRTLDYLCNLNLLTCVNHPDTALFMKPKRRRIEVKTSLEKMPKLGIVDKETCVNETTIGTSPQFSPSVGGIKQEPSHEVHDEPLVGVALQSLFQKDTTQSSVPVVLETDPCEIKQIFSPALDVEEADDKMSPNIDVLIKKFHAGLKQLQKQVNKKRSKMLDQKLSRTTKCTSPVMSRQKLVEQKPQTEPPTKKMPVSVKIRKGTAASSGDSIKPKNRDTIPATKQRAHTLPVDVSGISHYISSKKKNVASAKMFPPFVSKVKVDKSAISHVSESATEHPPKVPIPKLKTGANVVNIKPKMQTLPPEKVKAALESLNSYLTATGRKPTDGNTEYILLKIDDQHILVKLPFSSAAQLNSVTLSSVPVQTVFGTSLVHHQASQRDVNKHILQQMQSAADSNSTKTVSASASTTAKNVANMNSTFFIVKTASNTDLSSIAKTASITSALASSITTIASNTTNSSFRIMKSKTPGSTIKTFRDIVSTSSTNPQQAYPKNVSNSTVDKPPVNVAHVTPHSSATGAHPAIISLLRPGLSLHSQPGAFIKTQGSRIGNISITATSPAGLHSSPSYQAACGSSMVAGRGNYKIVLSTPNSVVLPEHRKKALALSEKEKAIKRRRLEAKYPLPPGVVIKSEPDDLGYEISTNWVNTSHSSFSSSLPGVLSGTSPGLSSQDQTWSAANSDNTGSLIPVTAAAGLQTQNANRNGDASDLPVKSTSDLEEELASEPCENMEESSDETDEPPALVDETTADGTEQIIQEGDTTHTQEDLPPILQPMFTSCASLAKRLNIMDTASTGFIQGKRTFTNTLSSQDTKHHTPTRDRGSSKLVDSTSDTSLHSEASHDSGIDTSSSNTSVSKLSFPVAEKSICKNLKIQHLKELLKRKEMELENMKKMRSEFPSLDLDHI